MERKNHTNREPELGEAHQIPAERQIATGRIALARERERRAAPAPQSNGVHVDAAPQRARRRRLGAAPSLRRSHATVTQASSRWM